MNQYEKFTIVPDAPPTEIFPDRLRASRDLRGWSQRELGRRVGIPATSIAHFEIRTRKPSFDTLRRLASTLEVTTDYLLGIVDAPDHHVSKLDDAERKLAKDFLKMLVEHSQSKRTKE